MKKMYIISAIIMAFALFLAVGIGIGIKISTPKKAIPYHNECPMCHSEVKLITHQFKFNTQYSIECLNRDCELETGYFKDKEELVEKWNKMFKTLNERKEE